MKELEHGKPSTYNNRKCRCADCTKAWADYIRERGYVKRYQQRKRDERKSVTFPETSSWTPGPWEGIN